jgi:two-component system, OmpR family, sensor kinase
VGRLPRALRQLRFRVPATAMAVLAISLLVAAALAYELLLTDGRRDADVVLAREHERFERSTARLLLEVQEDVPELAPAAAMREAVRRYLELNPSTEYYWTIVRFDGGGTLASANGPPELEPLFRSGRLPPGQPNVRETLETDAGEVRTSSAPVRLDGREIATLQVVTPLAPVRAEALEAAGMLAAAAGLSLLLGGILLSASLVRALAPLSVLASTARSTELRSLQARVGEPGTDDEVGLLAREFNTMLDRLDRASSAQREFMASIGHELRTPLTIAAGHLELLETSGRHDPEMVAETVAIVGEELGRMGRLVNDLMAIARSEMEDFVRPRTVELVAWFEELELRLSGTEHARDVRILPPPPIRFHADPDRLAQAVLNLVTNAAVHTPAGTVIEVAAATEGQQVVITVADDGPGIPETIRDAAFEPFVRSGEVATSTGLGLAVVRAIVDAHGGRVRLDTGDGGTTVALHLPDARVRPDDAGLDEGIGPAEPASDGTGGLPPRPGAVTGPTSRSVSSASDGDPTVPIPQQGRGG